MGPFTYVESQQYGLNNSITLSDISSSDRVIHQAVMLLLWFVLSSAIYLDSFYVFHPSSRRNPGPSSCLVFT